ncbi:invasion associated locus B family protein [Methylocapsa polymorpha]|uniref:Invasion associated locus B family protein n=1 Tax=Methylocapsa polymorpha TaxID=3080828 RepID=A0ABZ0HT29_9HYPH|nr:invasion associated locus B family protein [Methylocapsa sp. RX1]
MTSIKSSWGFRRLALSLSVCAAFLPAQTSAAGGPPESPDAAKKTAALPGGAQAVSETFEDWLVACSVAQGKKRCVINQQQTDAKTQQRLIAVELQPRNGGADGLLVLPFGLELDKGATLKAGDAQIGQTLRFKTCVPQGCVVPVSFEQKTLETLYKAAAVVVTAHAENGQTLSFQISLKGFGPALSRASALGE